ncbi:transcriptional regulator, IclR family [Sphingomonas gellani]|uniref:Transcriptional regulator, IclR family n=1 Tax=Sphingomonas gellani TaxID=1166340 RepID=A0A1H8AZR9_9SPHN|nr:IclR family transcriptional regulator [Sphingomonas gellani]SEM75404.1 transcriptional regulator, IclR family [Sphingomonas gellani]
MSSEPKYRAPALEKGLMILETLARSSEPMTMSDISAAVSRSRNEIFRMLQVLEEMGYISRDTAGAYALTNRLFALGMQQPPIRDLVSTSLPVMHHLAEQAGQSCQLAVASGAEMVVIARVEAPGMLGFAVRVGYRRPLHLSASGETILAFQPERARDQMIDEIERLDPSVSRAALLKTLAAVREAGHVTHHSPVLKGIVDISAPILVQATAMAALTVPFVEGTEDHADIDRATALVIEAADMVSHALEGTRID